MGQMYFSPITGRCVVRDEPGFDPDHPGVPMVEYDPTKHATLASRIQAHPLPPPTPEDHA